MAAMAKDFIDMILSPNEKYMERTVPVGNGGCAAEALNGYRIASACFAPNRSFLRLRARQNSTET
ncbi:hypothetical protein [Paramesorhizobium deserti]|uniref:hypothetical protein n=1 Tax=Paramesorhizobium deserti TaxID=1494590 RepID=UPI0012900970|nr:hypothetical protein [Paramesorhizobium deserti]